MNSINGGGVCKETRDAVNGKPKTARKEMTRQAARLYTSRIESIRDV